MASSTSKKAIVERFDREPLRGFVSLQSWLTPEGAEVMSTSGNVSVSPYSDIKAVYFVKDTDRPPFSSERRLFTSRPKSEGLWVRMLFRDGDVIDGIVSNNLLQLENFGFTIVPPDPSGNCQRLFVPKAALADIKVLGVIGSPLRRRKRVPPSENQISLFE